MRITQEDRWSGGAGDATASPASRLSSNGTYSWSPFTPDIITRSPQPETGNYIPPLFPGASRWHQTGDGDADARALYQRHYSCRERSHRRSKLFVGPGEKLVLITHQADALIVFRKFRSHDTMHGHGVNCSVFRNEGHFRSSSLIREAVEEWAWKRWPGERLYTYVNGQRVVSSNPGYCFKCAGWKRCGVTIGGLIVLELLTSG